MTSIRDRIEEHHAFTPDCHVIHLILFSLGTCSVESIAIRGSHERRMIEDHLASSADSSSPDIYFSALNPLLHCHSRIG